MPFKPGNKLATGRPMGAINRSTEMAKLTLARIADEGLNNLKEDLAKIRIKDPIQAAKIYLQLLEYILPKQSRVEVKGEIEAKIHSINININRSDSKEE